MRLFLEKYSITIVRCQPCAFHTKGIAAVAGPMVGTGVIYKAHAFRQGFDIFLAIQR